MYCLDASVIVNSYNKNEEFHKYSKRFIDYIKRERIAVILPEIVCPEVSSAISRGTEESAIAIEFVREMRGISHFTFIPVDDELSNDASKIAAEGRLRGCDVIYVAVVRKFDLKLVTLDGQQGERASSIVKVITPQEEVELLGLV